MSCIATEPTPQQLARSHKAQLERLRARHERRVDRLIKVGNRHDDCEVERKIINALNHAIALLDVEMRRESVTDQRDAPADFRTGHDGALACRHRDCSCCDECASAHPEIVEVYGAHFWVADVAERARLRADMSREK
jgi:hypothetical protein